MRVAGENVAAASLTASPHVRPDVTRNVDAYERLAEAARTSQYTDIFRPVVAAIGEEMGNNAQQFEEMTRRIGGLQAQLDEVRRAAMMEKAQLDEVSRAAMTVKAQLDEVRRAAMTEKAQRVCARGLTDELERQAVVVQQAAAAAAAGAAYVPPAKRSDCILRKLAAADKEAAIARIAGWWGGGIDKKRIDMFWDARGTSNDGAPPVLGDDVTVDHLLRLNKLLFDDDDEAERWAVISAWHVMREGVAAGLYPRLPQPNRTLPTLCAADIDALIAAYGTVDITDERARYEAQHRAAAGNVQ